MTVVETVRESAPVTTADVLNRAADLLEEFGWCQGVSGRRDLGRFCARGAIAAALTDYTGREHHGMCDSTVMEYDRLVGDGPLWAWNDAPGRTKAEVVARLRDAARNAA